VKRGLACSYEHMPRRPEVAAMATPFRNWLPGMGVGPSSSSISESASVSAGGCSLLGAFQGRGSLVPLGSESEVQVPRMPVVAGSNEMNWYYDDGTMTTGSGRDSTHAKQSFVPSIETPQCGNTSRWASESAATSANNVNVDGFVSADSSQPSVDDNNTRISKAPLSTPNSSFLLGHWEALKRIPNQMQHLLNRKPAKTMSDLLRGNFLQATFESYALGFDKNQLPPFIHQSCIMKDIGSQEAKFAHLPEPLANCKAILLIELAKTSASRPFVTKTLLLEVQRMHIEV
jgi:hypothetical protein